MKIISWLRERGSTNFVVVGEKFSSGPKISSQINDLMSDEKMTICFKSLSKLNSSEDASRLIEETNRLAPLDSVFFVSMVSALQNHEIQVYKISPLNT